MRHTEVWDGEREAAPHCRWIQAPVFQQQLQPTPLVLGKRVTAAQLRWK